MKKILLIGPEVTDFLNPLAHKLKGIGYSVDLLETRKIPRTNASISESYSNVLNYNDLSGRRITVVKALKYLFTVEFYKNFLKTFFLNSLGGKSRIIKSIRNAISAQHKKEIFAPILNSYDLIHFHSLSTELLSYVEYISQDKRIILSYWGSDLFLKLRSEVNYKDELRDYFVELKALKRTDFITVHNYEMERAVIAKFGPGIGNKVIRALFGMSDKIFDMIDESRKNYPDLNFLQKYNIPENKIKITIGYCGNPISNHLLIIEEIQSIQKLIKEKIHLLVPMTYGNFSSEYKEEVRQKLNKTNISYTLFDKILSVDELVKLRVSSNVMIQMSKSDAFSVSVCEYLYADNLLISAIWLPYSPLRLEQIFFYETDFLRLNETITYAVHNYDEIKIKIIENPDKIKKLNGFNHTWHQWVDMLDVLS